MEDALAAIEVLDEFGDAAGEAEFGFLIGALVFECDFQAFVQEGELAEALGKRVVAVIERGEDRRVGMEGDFRAGFAGFSTGLELRCGIALFVGLLPDFAFAPDFEIEPVRERVDDGDADAVQAAGNFVGIAVEFSAGMKNGHDDFGGGLFFRGVHVDGDAAAVVDYGDAVVVVHGDVDLVAEAGHGFVHGIVGNFPDQMVETHFTGGADVHGGALADGFETA